MTLVDHDVFYVQLDAIPAPMEPVKLASQIIHTSLLQARVS